MHRSVDLENRKDGTLIDKKYSNASWLSSDSSTKWICDLLPSDTFTPKIAIESESTLPSGDLARYSKYCESKSFTIISPWKCADKKQIVPASFVCDGEADCSDESDEAKWLCQGETNYYLWGTVLTCFFIGFIVYLPGNLTSSLMNTF